MRSIEDRKDVRNRGGLYQMIRRAVQDEISTSRPSLALRREGGFCHVSPEVYDCISDGAGQLIIFYGITLFRNPDFTGTNIEVVLHFVGR